jgi:hypothetical protein
MASPNKKTLQDINDLLSKIDKAYKKIGESNPFDRSVSSVQNIDKEFKKLDSSLDGLNSRIANLNASFGDIQSQLQAIAKEINPKSFDASKQLQKGLKGVVDQAQKLRFEEEGINRLSQKQLEKIKERAEQEKSNSIRAAKDLTNYSKLWKDVNGKVDQSTKAFQALTDEQKTAVAFIEDQSSAMDSIIDKASKRIQQEKELAKSLGATPAILKGIGGTLSKLGLPDLGISEALEETEKILLKEEGRVSSYKAMSVASEQLGKGLAKQVTSANLFQGAMLLSLSVLKELDKTTEDTARNMNMTYNEANAYRQELSAASIINNDQFVTSKGMLETSMAINASLGTNVKLSEDQLATFTKLRTTAGLTNDELVGVNKLTIGTNKSLEDATGEILAQAKLTGLNNGVLLNEKEILKGIKDVSAATTLSLGKNPKAIAEAVAQAKALGMNLQQVENISSQILDFESSIQNELEAELLLGKDINLEKARQAALNNDLATVASEVAKQAGTAAEFGEMNRIQQDALAKSVGMSRDDLAQTLFVQEQLVGLSEDQAEKRQELLDQRIQEVGLEQAMREMEKGGIENLETQAGMATKFNAIVEKIQEAFVAVGTAVMPIVDMIASMFGALAEMPMILGAIAGALVAMKAISGILAVKSIIKAAAELFASNAKFGPAGIVIATAGLGAMMAGIASVTSKAKSIGDMMSPARGKTQVSTAEGGLFELSPNDDLVAAPGAASMMTKKGERGGGARRDAALISEIQTLISVNKQILAKSPVIEMNGNQVGQEINQSERAVQ